jgi:hypothetical protein
MKNNDIRSFALPALLAIVCIGLWVVAIRNRAVAVVLPSLADSFSSYERRISDALLGSQPNATNAAEQMQTEILRLSTPDDGELRIIVKAGIATPFDITPADSWKELLRNGDYLLLNSVDGRQSITTDPRTISYAFGHACNLGALQGQSLRPGEIRVHQCLAAGSPGYDTPENEPIGNYVGQFGQGYVVNAAVVTWDVQSNQTSTEDFARSCASETAREQKQDCFRRALDNVAKALFFNTHNEEFAKSTWVLPAIGSGSYGSLNRADFYAAIRENLENALRSDALRNKQWPSRLVLLVYPRDGRWGETVQGISKQFGSLAEELNRTPTGEKVSSLYQWVGIAGALALIWLMEIVAPPPTGTWIKELLPAGKRLGPTVVWFGIAAGLASALQQIPSAVGWHMRGATSILIGACATLIAPWLTSVTKAFEKGIETKQRQGESSTP